MTGCVAEGRTNRTARSISARPLPRGESAARIVVIHRPGPMWDDPSLRYLDPAGIQAHVDHYKNLCAQGKLVAGGSFLDAGGGMMVLSDDVGLEEATRIVENDPAVRSGLLLAEIHSWLAFAENEEA